MKQKKYESLLKQVRKWSEKYLVEDINIVIREHSTELTSEQFTELMKLRDVALDPPDVRDKEWTVVLYANEGKFASVVVSAGSLKEAIKKRLRPVIETRLGWDAGELAIVGVFEGALKDLESNKARDWWTK